LETPFKEAKWVVAPVVPVNVVGTALGFAAFGALLAAVHAAYPGATDSSLRIVWMSVGFAFVFAGTMGARGVLGRRRVEVVIDARGIHLGRRTLAGSELAVIAHGTMHHEAKVSLGAAPVATEDTFLDIRLASGRRHRLLALDQIVIDLPLALAPLEAANPSIVVVPAGLVPRAVSPRLVYGAVAVVAAGGIGWLVVSGWLEDRDRERRNREEDAARLSDGEVGLALARLDVARASSAPAACPAELHGDVPGIEEPWRAWLASRDRAYDTRPKGSMVDDSEVFRYVAWEESPSTVEGWLERAALVRSLLASPWVAVIAEDRSVVVYRLDRGAPVCKVGSVPYQDAVWRLAPSRRRP
jgi:hypothetical protein